MRTFLAALLLLVVTGCGEPDAPPPSAEELGSMARQEVSKFTTLAKEDQERARKMLPSLRETLKAYADASLGPNKLKYSKLQNSAKELNDLYEAGADWTEIDAKVDELAAASEGLPGATSEAVE